MLLRPPARAKYLMQPGHVPHSLTPFPGERFTFLGILDGLLAWSLLLNLKPLSCSPWPSMRIMSIMFYPEL